MSDPTAGATGEAGSGNPTPPAPPAPPPATATFTQEDLDRTVGARVAEAQRQATRKLVEELGFSKVDDLKTLVQAQRDAEKAQMTEAERLRGEAQEAKAQAEAHQRALAALQHSVNIERELAKAGAQGDTARLVRMVDLEPGSDPAAVSGAVEALKKDYPALFGAATAPPFPSTETPGGGSPVRTPPTQNPLKSGEEKAKAYMAGQRTGF